MWVILVVDLFLKLILWGLVDPGDDDSGDRQTDRRMRRSDVLSDGFKITIRRLPGCLSPSQVFDSYVTVGGVNGERRASAT
jgi:hypothetical protein